MRNVPEMSVVIPTIGRSRSLEKTLRCLLESTGVAFECIIVDQNSETSIVESIVNSINDSRIIVVRQKEASLPAARNRGIKSSVGMIILFLDDDVEFGRDFLSRHMEAHKAHVDVWAITGRIKLVPPHFYENTRVLADIDSDTARFVVNFDQDIAQTSRFISGGNVSMRKSTFDKVGLFDESYRGNALYEEIDFSMKLESAGLKIMFYPEAELVHLREENGGCRVKKGIRWGMDKFYNTGFFYGRWFLDKLPVKFFVSNKNEIEFMTRRKNGRDWFAVAVYFGALVVGIVKGFVSKKRSGFRSF